MKKLQTLVVIITGIALFIDDVEAGWKFWQKDTNAMTTETLGASNTTRRPQTLSADINREAPLAKNHSHLKNVNSQNYHDWAVELTGAGGHRPTPQPTQVPLKPKDQNSPANAPQQRPSTLAQDPKEHFPALPTGNSQTQSPRATSPTTHTMSFADAAKKGAQSTTQSTPVRARTNPPPVTTARTNSGGNVSRLGAIDTGNPTFSKGNTVTDQDLEKLSEALFTKDVNNAYKYITLNLQGQTSGSNPNDVAPEPLLSVKAEALQTPTVQKVLAIHDNYKLDTRESEYISPSQRQEESNLVDTFLSTNVMSMAMRFLADKGFVRKDYYEYKDLLRRIWFNLYSRGGGKVGSTGFEHVFLTELKSGEEVSGLHNWIYFNAEETKRRLDYLGYVKKLDLGDKASIVKVHLKFNGVDKPVSNVFVGTSPELEMALYTVCFLARPELSCPVSLGGSKFTIITHKFKYRGNELIGSAYPDI